MRSAILAALFLTVAVHAAPAKFTSHPPVRPLPTVSTRPLPKSPLLFVDAAKGDDTTAGTIDKPFRTIQHAFTKVKSGDTIVLRGGTYYEHATLTTSGTSGQRIGIRSHPGEIAIIDGGLREFAEAPEKAWEPCPDGADGEFRSVKAYPDLGSHGDMTHLLGNFADSMTPLHGYHWHGDLRSNNIWWNIGDKVGDASFIYCGPGIVHDTATGRIHVRLAHTKMPYLADSDNYTGETDPRKIALVIAGNRDASPLTLKDCSHVLMQDLVFRGARGATIEITGCEDVECDGLIVYGGQSCFGVRETTGLRLVHTACRGIAAPWTFRGSLKYRAIESRIFSASGWTPTGRDSHDFEFAYCEFTDSVDGVFIGNVSRVLFHHNLVENITDDAIFLTAGSAFDGRTPGGDVQIYQNRFARNLTCFAFGVGHGRQKVLLDGVQTGAGVQIYRNVFDFRQPVWYHQPHGPDDGKEVTSKGRFAGDHGSPAWEPMLIYHNTIIADDVPRNTYGTWGLGNAMEKGTRRRVFNNVVVQLNALPGNFFPPTRTDFQADGNLNWSVALGAKQQGDFRAKFRASKELAESKVKYPPGWGAADKFADPAFVKFDADWKTAVDLGLSPNSPAVDAGVAIPAEWNDPLRSSDANRPDIGAVPLNRSPANIGLHGRLNAYGNPAKLDVKPTFERLKYVPHPKQERVHRPAAIVEGYPAFDVPLLEFALRQNNVPVDIFEKQWLDPKKFKDYGIIAMNGSLTRGKVSPATFSEADLRLLDAYMKDGGIFILTASAREVFNTAEGKRFLGDMTGRSIAIKGPKPPVLLEGHPWVKHLDVKSSAAWIETLGKQPASPLSIDKGESVIGLPGQYAVLYRQTVGKGQFIYIGWQVHDSLPYTRDKKSTVAGEKLFEDQVGILRSLVADALSK